MRDPHARPGGASSSLIVVLGMLSAFGPLSIDLYLPGMPQLIAELGADHSLGQATLSASMIGLAAGQLLLGPLSDRYGRRTPMLIGVGVFALMSVVCALAPNMPVLLAARVVQGLGGSAGIVITRAIIRDVSSGAEAARAFAMLAAILGITPVLAPLLGGALLLITDWRGLFLALAVIGAALVALIWFRVPDTLPAERRVDAGLRALGAEAAGVLRNRPFVVMAIALALGSLALFNYVSMSAFVLQEQFGFDEQQFSIAFAVNSFGILGGSMLGRWLVGRMRVRVLAVGALVVSTLASAALLVLSLAGAPLVAVLVPLFFAVSVHGVVLANTTALAMSSVSRAVGTASALLGALQMGTGALVPPLVSLGGVTMTLMAGTMLTGAAFGLLVLLAALRRWRYADALRPRPALRARAPLGACDGAPSRTARRRSGRDRRGARPHRRRRRSGRRIVYETDRRRLD